MKYSLTFSYIRWNGSGFDAPELTWKYSGSSGVGRVRGRGESRVDDEVDRDDVEHRVGKARELGQQAATVGHDQRVGDLEAVDPARERMLQRALDDGRSHHREAVAALRPELLGGALGEGLGERVDVGPAEALGARAAVVDEASCTHSTRASSLDRATACGPSLPCCAFAVPSVSGAAVGLARLELDALAGRTRGLVLGTPVDLVGERGLGHDALAEAADVAGRDVHDVRVAPLASSAP